MLNVAVEWELLRFAPKIEKLKEERRTSLIEKCAEELLLRHAPQPLADIIIIVMDCGMQPNEAMRMRWEHISWERNIVLTPVRNKYYSNRFVLLSERLGALLKERERVAESEWVFPSPRSAAGHLVTVAKQWRETLALANAECKAKNMPTLPPDTQLCCARRTYLKTMEDRRSDGGYAIGVAEIIKRTQPP
jgi:integrase